MTLDFGGLNKVGGGKPSADLDFGGLTRADGGVAEPMTTKAAAPSDSGGGFFSELGHSFKETLLSQNPTAYADAMEAAAILTKEKEPTLIERGLKLAGRISNPVGALADDIGAVTGIHASDVLESGSKKMRELAKAGSDGKGPAVPSTSDIHSPSDALSWFGSAIGNAVASSAPSIATGLAATAVTKNPGAGFVAGAALGSYPQNFGDMYSTLRDNKGVQQAIKDGRLTKDQIAGIAAGVAVPLAALDAVGDKLATPFVNKLKGEIVSRILKRIVIGGTAEGVTEGMQQTLQEATLAASGGDHTLSEAAWNIWENIAQGTVGGTAIGAATEPFAGEAQSEDLKSGTPSIDERMVVDAAGAGGAATAQPQAAPPSSAGPSPVSGAAEVPPAAAAPAGGPAPVGSDDDLLRQTLGDDAEELTKPGGEHLNEGDLRSPLPTADIREGKKIIDDLIGAPGGTGASPELSSNESTTIKHVDEMPDIPEAEPSFLSTFSPEDRAAFDSVPAANRDVAMALGRKIDEIGGERAAKLQGKLDDIIASIMPTKASAPTAPAMTTPVRPGGVRPDIAMSAIDLLDEGFDWDGAVAEARHRKLGGKPRAAPAPQVATPDYLASRQKEVPTGYSIRQENGETSLIGPSGSRVAYSEGYGRDDIDAMVQSAQGRAPVAPAPKPKPKAKTERAPLDLVQFLAAEGGLADHKGEIASLGMKKHFVPGVGKLMRESGMNLDRAREKAEEAGYIGKPGEYQTTTVADLLDAMDKNMRGQRVYAREDAGRAANRAAEKGTTSSEGQARQAEFDQMMKDVGAVLKPDEIKEVLALVADGMWAEEAAIEVMERNALAREAEVEQSAGDDDAEGKSRARGETAEAGRKPAGEGARGNATPRSESGSGKQAGAAAKISAETSLSRTASWVIRNKKTGEVVMETFDRKKVDALNTDKYEAVPIGDYLGTMNKAIKDAGGVQPSQKAVNAAFDKLREARDIPFFSIRGPSEKTQAGEQSVLPGAEKISDKALAERKMQGAKKATVAQKDTEGLPLFGDDRKQLSMFSLRKKITNTPAFKAWFGDSKVVDENGEPQVVYHGTAKAFPKIDMKKGAQGVFWVTSDRSAIERGEVGASGKGVVMELYAKIERPAGWKEYDQLSIGELIGRGYDGVILPDSDGTFVAIVFEPTQIKSVNNAGTFSPTDPRIMAKVSKDSVDKLETDLRDELGLRSLSLFLDGSGNLKINMIAVPRDQMGQGKGSKAMERIVAFADRHGLRTILTTGQKDDGFGTTSQSRLTSFYKRFGFVENKGRAKDFSITATMYRDPEVGPRGKVTSATLDADTGAFDITEEDKGIQVKLKLTPAFVAKAAAVQRALRERLDKLGLPQVGIRVAEKIQMAVKGTLYDADGVQFQKLISIALDAENIGRTLDHEVLHALRELGVFTDTEWAILSRKSNKEWRTKYDIAKFYSNRSEAVQTEEGIAEALADWMQGAQMDGIIAKAFRKVKLALKGIYQVLTSNDIRTAEDIFAQVASGKVGRRAGREGFRQEPMMQPAWHGTPHDFDRFSLDAMGTGEGAQAFGWGLYFAGKKGIAEYYRDKLARQGAKAVAAKDVPTDVAEALSDYAEGYAPEDAEAGILKDLDREIPETQKWIDSLDAETRANPSESAKGTIESLPLLKAMRAALVAGKVKFEKPGKLFKVDLPEDSELMDWDAPLSEQPEGVREKLATLGITDRFAPEEIADVKARAIVKRALTLNDGDPDGIGLTIDNDQSLYNQAMALAKRDGIDTDEVSPGDYIADNLARDYLYELGLSRSQTGERIYRDLSAKMGTQSGKEELGWTSTDAVPKDDRAASEALRAAGIPGHRFLDSSSRDSGEGTHNYVVYDDARISVEAKFRLRGLSGGIPPISSVTTPLGRRMMDYIKNNAKGDDETVKEYAQRKIVDYLAPVAQMIKEAGGTVADQMHVYRQARLAIDMATKGIMDMHGVYVTPMLDTLAKAGATMEDLDRYARAKHTPERNRVVGLRNEPGSQFHNAVTDHSVKGASGISTNEAKKILQDFQKGDQTKLAGIKEAHRMLREMLDQNLKTLLASGQISQAQYDDLTKQYVNYVPMMGEEMLNENGDFSVPGRGSGFDVRGKEFKGATGRFSEAENAPAWAISLAERGILRSKKNEVGKAALRFVNEFSPNGEIAEVYWKEDSPIQDPDMADIEKAQTVYKRELGKDGKVKKVKVPPSTISPDMFATKVGGRQIYIKFKDARIGGALKNLGVIELDAISRLSRKLTNFQSWANTRANPAFIPINAIRDAMTAFIHLLDEGFSTVEAAKVIGGIPKAFGAVWRGARGKAAKGQMDAMRQEWEQNGGRLIYAPHNSIEDTIKSLRKEMKAAASNPGSARRVGRYLLSLLGDLNDTIENSVRLSAYAAARAKGTSPQQSAFLARDLTVDFRKHGEIGPKMNSWFTFFNASVQGNINVAARLARSRKVQAAAASIMVSGVLMDILNRAIAGDDDDGENEYEKMLRNEPWKFERQMVIFYGPGKGAYFTIPMPYGYNAMYYTGLQMSAAGHGDISPLEAVGNSVRTTFDAFNPMGGAGSYLTMVAPTFLDPAIELATNEGFSGVPITPTRYPGDVKPDSQMSFRSTSDIWKSIAEGVNNWTGGDEAEPGAIDVSPDTLEYLWGFASGGIGRFLGQTYDTTSKLVTGRAGEIEPEKVPFVRSFFGRQDDDNKKTEYYNLREEVSTVKKRIEAKKDISAEVAREYRDAHPVETHSVAAFDAAEKQLKVVRKQRRKLDADEDMPSADREAKNKELDKREIDIMNRARMAYARNRKKEAGQ